MQRHKLILESAQDGTFHTFFRNNHSRWIYMNMALDGEAVHITDCFYIDRPKNQGSYAIPKKLKTKHCNLNALLEVCANELDKRFFGIEIRNKTDRLTKEAYIQSVVSDSGKFKPLILVGKIEGDELPERLATRLKNRIHRSIYLDLRRKDRDS